MNRKQIGYGLLGLAAAGTAAYIIYKALKEPVDPPTTVDKVDLERYLGDWYDIAHYPAPFQKGCVGSMAHYSLRDDGDIRVVNTCFKGDLDGKTESAEAKAWVVDEETNAKLKVQFFWPFSGDYWIIGLDEDYQWAVVGHPKREYLWILSRTPEIENALKVEILDLIRDKGYDLSKLKWIPQKEQHWTEEELAG